MRLGPEDVKKIAHLARLAVSDEDIAPLCKDLTNILQLVAEMGQADTSNVQPLAHPYDIEQPLRKDAITKSNERELLQSIAPDTQAGLYIVPQVIESE
jgi:aspartyl-tRNA(Asn)/glutamyl-tRNA(Gln) amidotransferase subunit C